MTEKKWLKYVSGIVGAFAVGIVLMFGATKVVYPAVSELIGLSVASAANAWNNVKDAAVGDGLSSGILAQQVYVWNGLSFDRVRGDTTNGMDVDVTRMSGSITPADAYANPTTANQVWSLNGTFNGSTWDRIRSATADALTSTGVVTAGNMVFNGSTFDRMRAVTADALAQTGLQAAGNITYNGSTWDRWRAQVSPVQGGSPTGTLFNSSTTGGVASAVTVTIAASANTRAHLYGLDAYCSAGTSGITVTDGGTTIWQTPTIEVGTTRDAIDFPAALTSATNSAMVITLASCGGGNTGTLMVQADRF